MTACASVAGSGADDGGDSLILMSILGREVKARPSWRAFGAVLCAFLLLGSQASLAAIPQRLKDGLTSPSVKVRVIAVAALAKTKDAEAAALIRPMLNDSEGVVRAAAVDGLVFLKDVSALAAVTALAKDPSDAVRAVVARSVPLLEAMSIQVDVGDVGDLSGKASPALVSRLQSTFEAELRKLVKGVTLKRGGVSKGYGAILKVRSITRGKDGANEFLEIKCDMTLVEFPGKVLRVSSSAAAAAGVEGSLPVSMEADLANDAIDACAPSLAKDFADYLEGRRGR